MSGFIVVDFVANTVQPYIYVGDHTNNKQIKGYLSFDISGISALDDVTIKEVSLSMPVSGIENHPELMPEVHVRVFDYGASLELADQVSGGDMVKTFPTVAAMTNFNFSSTELAAKLQGAVNGGDSRIQLKISLAGINSDAIADWYRFTKSAVVLHVKYEVPG
jgi:hypothetical protein